MWNAEKMSCCTHSMQCSPTHPSQQTSNIGNIFVCLCFVLICFFVDIVSGGGGGGDDDFVNILHISLCFVSFLI